MTSAESLLAYHQGELQETVEELKIVRKKQEGEEGKKDSLEQDNQLEKLEDEVGDMFFGMLMIAHKMEKEYG